MVSSSSIAFMVFSGLVALLTPILLLIYGRKKYKISMKAVGVGILTFIVFAQVLEQILHSVVIGKGLVKPGTIGLAIYGALAAGVFEEVGRYVFMKFLLKKNREWKDGFAFGIGHGGIEAILISVVASVQNIIFAIMVNNNTFGTLISAVGSNPAAKQQMEALRSTLINTSPFMFALGGIERIFAISIHIAGSITVMYAIRSKKIIYLFVAILGHALVDFLPGLYQAGMFGVIQAEIIVGIIAIGMVAFIVKSKSIFRWDN